MKPESQNPYDAPPTTAFTEELLEDGEPDPWGEGLPCHHCGRIVPVTAIQCPGCGVQAKYLRLMIIVVACLFLIIMKLPDFFLNSDGEYSGVILLAKGLALVVAIPLVFVAYVKMKGNVW